ncbi:hypothetical protein LUZ60_011974 [Juncus effusus]|nr:hypothetical protein LUZ60_011974 [Juncus effusus]
MEPSTPLLIPPPNPNPTISTPSPNPNLPHKTNTYQIGGVPVEFPYRPYGTQLAFMGRVISTLNKARRQGHCHALLESPTGTGKSLSLLCSALAWQKEYKSRPVGLSPVKCTPDPLLHGGGFIPEPEPSRNNLDQNTPSTSGKVQKKQTVPIIFYASRTHSQISQVIREYRKTTYRVPMGILASRKHYCTNKNVCMSENIDETCKTLLKDEGLGCLEFKNAHKIKAHPSVQKGGSNEVHDIEDLVKLGHTVKGCAYFAAQTLASEAQLVFCPYSYVINPIVRRAMDVDIKGSILILDEAHNIEDMAREGGSVDVDEEILFVLQTELGQLCTDESNSMIYQPLHYVIQGLISWIAERKDNLQKHEFERHSSYWTGDKAVRELQHAGITQQCFPILQECATKAVKAATEAEPDGIFLTGISSTTLEGLFSSLSYFFSENGSRTSDYQLTLQKYVKRDPKNASSGWKCTLSLWCLNPAVVFRDIANLSLSVILTSGTLSPMGSFASELGVQFETIMEAPHVIDVESQLWASVISTGPSNCPLNASYKTADSYTFQDSLGVSLEEICKVVPGGALVFFPSYKLLEKLQTRWSLTGQWSKLNAQKPVFVEPRGSTDEFDLALKGYYDAIAGKNKAQNKKNGNKISKNRVIKDSANSVKKGAAFLAVCRGKVSEGIDFSNENARVVVIVGIPFPNIYDVQVMLKKKYNDTYKSSKGLLTGSEWYCHQAFRALNQAAGRCIRHKSDYGAIILLDERFKEERNLVYISKWLKNSIKQYNSFEESLNGLQTFFQNVEGKIKKESKDLDINTPSQNNSFVCETEQNLSSKPKKNQRAKMSISPNKNESIAKNSPLSAFNNNKESSDDLFKKFLYSPKVETISPDTSRYSTSGITHETNSPVPELPTLESLEASRKSKNYQIAPVTSKYFQNSNTYSTFTPEKKVPFIDLSLEEESNFNPSVNSTNQKRRKIIPSQLTNCTTYNDHFSPQKPNNVNNKVLTLGSKLHKLIHDSNKKEDKDSCISCKMCKCLLGTIPCAKSQISKVYFTKLLKHGSESMENSQVDCLICESLCFNKELLKGNKNEGIWSEKDGCVFKIVNCLFCPFGNDNNNNACLGVQVLATDSSNAHLLNKVILFADNLDVKHEESTKEDLSLKHEDVEMEIKITPVQKNSPLEIEKFAYTPLPRDEFANSRKSKLRLLKKSQYGGVDCQDGFCT